MVKPSAARPGARAHRVLAAGGVAVALALASSPARASAPAANADADDESVAAEPPATDAPAPDRRRGALQLGIASLLTGVGVGLVAFGIHEFGRAQDHLAFCRQIPGDVPDTGFGACSFDPPALGFTSAGLSWGLSIPLLVGAGLLFARGAAEFRGARAPSTRAHATVHPWWRHDGAGLGLALRF